MRIKGMILILYLSAITFPVLLFSTGIIKNPVPNMIEKEYIELVKVREIGDDLGGNNYLFYPYGMDNDKSFIFVYDNLQAKIIKFDINLNFIKSFGRKGQGPGEFSGTGRGYGVFIKVGIDGKLYLNDYRNRKIYIYSKELKYIDTYKCPLSNTTKNPMIDNNKNFFHISFVKKNIKIIKNGKMFFLIKNKYNFFDYLYTLPKNPDSWEDSFSYYYSLYSEIIDDSKILLFSKRSSKILLLNGNKINVINIWPRSALLSYKKKISHILKQGMDGYKPMFKKIFRSKSEKKSLYLHFGRDEKAKRNLLYKVSLDGRLLKVYFVKTKSGNSFTNFLLKIGDGFFAREEEKIVVYKEKI